MWSQRASVCLIFDVNLPCNGFKLFMKLHLLIRDVFNTFDLGILQNVRNRLVKLYALSFYVTKTVLVGPKWFWSDQIDLDLTIMIWSRPKWNGHHQNELVRSKLWFPTKLNHIWTWTIHFGHDQIITVKAKSIWSDQNHFRPTKTVLVT